MPAYPRTELEAMVERWLDVNKRAHESKDWRLLGELYTEDATYGWNLGPNEEFMAVGRQEIVDFALGTEMAGLEGWSYPYERVLIDEKIGEVIGLWRQVADAPRPDGGDYEVAGLGGSWFRYGGDGQWDWQRDFFDLGNVTALFIEMIQADTLSEGMKRRMEAAGKELPGHYRMGQSPARLWPDSPS